MSNIKVGDRVRLTGKFLRNTGQTKGPEGKRRWLVTAIDGDWAVTDEKADVRWFTEDELQEDPSLKWRRIALANLEVV